MIIIKPYRQDKDLGRAYNDAFRDCSDSHICLMDIDTLFLLPEQPALVEKYIEKYPNAVLTCYTNRISTLTDQLYQGRISEERDIMKHLKIARLILNQTLPIARTNKKQISGFLMVIPRSVWERINFKEGMGCLGVDTQFTRDCQANGIDIIIMTGIYIFHLYRIENGIYHKEHLKI